MSTTASNGVRAGGGLPRGGASPADDPFLEPNANRSIYATIRREIVTLVFRPGERLSENELAARFGTSRAPVREALIRLVKDGLIEVRPQRGSFVSKISLQAVERARFIREALEIAIVRRAAEQGLSEIAFTEAERSIAQQRLARNNPEWFTRWDDAFHKAFAEGTALIGVWEVIEREKAQFDRIRVLSLPDVTSVDVLIEQHKAILEAIFERKPCAAEQAIRDHMREVSRVIDGLAMQYPDLIVADAQSP